MICQERELENGCFKMNAQCCVCGMEIHGNLDGRDIICPMCTQRFCVDKIKDSNGNPINVRDFWKMLDRERKKRK